MSRAAAFVLSLLMAASPASAANVFAVSRAAPMPGVRLVPGFLLQSGLAGGSGLSVRPSAAPSLTPILPLTGSPSVAAPSLSPILPLTGPPSAVVPQVPALVPASAAAPVLARPRASAAPAVLRAAPIAAAPLRAAAPRTRGPASRSFEAAGVQAAAIFDGSGPLGEPAAPLDLQVKPAMMGAEAQEGAAAPYGEELLERTRALYRRYFPEFDVGVNVRLEFAEGSRGTKGSHESNPRRKGQAHTITLIEDAPIVKANERERTVTPFSRNADKSPKLSNHHLQRWVQRTVTLFHEYSHGVFHELTPGISRGFIMPESGIFRFDVAAAMDEGFAVLMELVLIDRMVADAEELGLTSWDVADLKIRKRQRVFDMRRQKDHYTEGTFYFMHRLYKQEGTEGVLRFIRDLDMERLYVLFTYNVPYRLIQGSPELFKAYLTKKGDPRLREGIDALARYIVGHAAPPGQEAGLKEILRRADLSALVRIARLFIKQSEKDSDPGVYSRFLERIARLDPEMAERLPDRP